MLFELHTIPPTLSKYVESIFYYKGLQPEHSIERVVPTGHLFIIFELDGIPRNTFDNQKLEPIETYRKVWISGMHKNYISISTHTDSEMLVIQFKPYGGFPFLHKAIHHFNDQVISGNVLSNGNLIQLREEIIYAEDSKSKFEKVESWLVNRMDDDKIPRDELIKIIEELSSNSMDQHNNIIKKYSKTQKTLINNCKKFCGLTPKVLHRIFRFNQILQEINQKKKVSWSQISYQFGYSDQSHFIKEFKEFSGFNPQEFIQDDHHNVPPNFFPLDK